MSLDVVVSWFRPPKPRKLRAVSAHLQQLQPGQYAGVAIYRPRDRRDLKPELYPAIGKAFHVSYACLAEPGELYAGQMLFQEQKAGALRSWLPEQDLEFVTVSGSLPVTNSTPVRTPSTAARVPPRTIRSDHRLQGARAS